MKKEEATRLIALTLAEMRSRPFEPMASEWSDATLLAHKFERAGYVTPEVEQEELTVYGYIVVGRDGQATHGGDDLLTQQEAIDNATEWTKDAQDNGIDWDYRVAAIVDQGGL
jgi:hypothetical protein